MLDPHSTENHNSGQLPRLIESVTTVNCFVAVDLSELSDAELFAGINALLAEARDNALAGLREGEVAL